MANQKRPRRKIHLVYRRSSALLKCTVLVSVLLSTLALITLRASISEQQARAADLRQKAAQLRQQNVTLEQSIQELGTTKSVRRIAGEKLGLVDPNTTFFYPTE